MFEDISVIFQKSIFKIIEVGACRVMVTLLDACQPGKNPFLFGKDILKSSLFQGMMLSLREVRELVRLSLVRKAYSTIPGKSGWEHHIVSILFGHFSQKNTYSERVPKHNLFLLKVLFK